MAERTHAGQPPFEEGVDENTPLLSAENPAAVSDSRASDESTLHTASISDDTDETVLDGSPEDKPLPVRQIVLLCYARFVEPVAFFSIFPFINQMCKEVGHLDDADVGFYSGLIESLFSLTQMCVMVLWGRAADRFGRKPVLVFSLLGCSAAITIFGMAKAIWQMILFRCLAGVFAGTIVTLRAMISEHSTTKTQAMAFSWFSFSGNLGILIGPLIGGVLVEPAKYYPGLFGGIPFFVNYPYALPSFAVGLIGFSATIISLFFVQETLRPKVRNRGGGDDDGEESDAGKPVPPSTSQILRAPGVGLVLYTYTHIMLLAIAYTAIVPVFWSTPVDIGGLGFAPYQISLLMALNGLAQAIWILLVFPPFHRRVGTNGVLRWCAMAYPCFFVVFPFFSMLLRHGGETGRWAFWISFPVVLAVGCGVSMSFTAIQLALNDISPSPQALGTLNALALTSISGIRSFSPALFSSLFALDVGTQTLAGYAIWIVLAALAGGFTLLSMHMPDYDELRRRREMEEREEVDE